MISDGKTVTLDYTLRIDDEIIDTSIGKKPLTYKQGQQMMIPGLESRVEGLAPGAEKIIVVPPSEAYGQVDPGNFMEIQKDQFSSDQPPEVGMVIQTKGNADQPMVGMIQDIKETSLIVDFNHPLAGKILTFDVKIIDVQ